MQIVVCDLVANWHDFFSRSLEKSENAEIPVSVGKVPDDDGMHRWNEQKMPSIWTIVVNIYVSRKIRFVADLSEQIRECRYKLYQVILRDVTNLWREGKSWARWPLHFKSPHIVECQLNRLLSFRLSFYHIFAENE